MVKLEATFVNIFSKFVFLVSNQVQEEKSVLIPNEKVNFLQMSLISNSFSCTNLWENQARFLLSRIIYHKQTAYNLIPFYKPHLGQVHNVFTTEILI